MPKVIKIKLGGHGGSVRVLEEMERIYNRKQARLTSYRLLKCGKPA
jgi:hypothetical protein